MRQLICFFMLICAAPAAAADLPSVQIELADRSKHSGPWTADTVRITTEAGKFEFQPARVKRLIVGETGHDQLEVDGLDTRLHGTVDVQTFVVDGQRYDRAQVRSLKHIRSGPPNIMADIVIPLVTLTALEIILGIDNIIFLAIVAGRLPRPQQPRARRLGLLAALLTRLGLLATLSFILGLTATLFTMPSLPLMRDLEAREISWRDLILLVGGLFLIAKSTYEIHDKLERPEGDHASRAGSTARFGVVLLEIAVIDIIFSLDSVITAVGMVESLWVMVTAMLIAVGVMMFFAETISRFVARNPTLKVLALAFLILIGVMLVAEGFGQHINKGYVYFAMAFSVAVETLNIRLRKKTDPLQLHNSELPAGIS